MLAHGVFDYILMLSSSVDESIPFVGTILFVAFIYFDIKLWKVGVRKINEMQEASKNQHISGMFKNNY